MPSSRKSPATGIRRSPRGSDQGRLGAERPQDRRRVGGGDGPAARAARRHQADVAVLLHAEADRPAPLVGLVVVVAARVDADVAAERPHVAELGRRDHAGRPREGRVAGGDLGVLRDAGERGAGAHHQAVPRASLDSRQLPDPAEADQHPRLHLEALHVRIEVGAAGDHRGLAAVLDEEPDRLGHAPRREVPEGRKPHHGCAPPPDRLRSLWRPRPSIERPRPVAGGRGDAARPARFTVGRAPSRGPRRPRAPRGRPRAAERGSARGTRRAGAAPARRAAPCPEPSGRAPSGSSRA